MTTAFIIIYSLYFLSIWLLLSFGKRSPFCTKWWILDIVRFCSSHSLFIRCRAWMLIYFFSILNLWSKGVVNLFSLKIALLCTFSALLSYFFPKMWAKSKLSIYASLIFTDFLFRKLLFLYPGLLDTIVCFLNPHLPLLYILLLLLFFINFLFLHFYTIRLILNGCFLSTIKT